MVILQFANSSSCSPWERISRAEPRASTARGEREGGREGVYVMVREQIAVAPPTFVVQRVV